MNFLMTKRSCRTLLNAKNDGLHTTSLSRNLKRLHKKYNDVFSFEYNQTIAKDGRVNDNLLKELYTDVSKLMRIHKWKGLKKFEFNLDRCQDISNKSLHILEHLISNHFAELQELTLIFSQCHLITDNGLKFGYKIKRYVFNLKSLSLDFHSCEQITYKSLERMGCEISRLSCLSHLELNFSSCFRIIDRGLEKLSLNICKRLNRLKHLTLNFGLCKRITDKSLEIMRFYIGHYLYGLQHLTLIFISCNSITDKPLETLAFEINRHLPNLKSLTLDFKHCSQITYGLPAKLQEQLQFIPNLSLSL